MKIPIILFIIIGSLLVIELVKCFVLVYVYLIIYLFTHADERRIFRELARVDRMKSENT